MRNNLSGSESNLILIKNFKLINKFYQTIIQDSFIIFEELDRMEIGL